MTLVSSTQSLGDSIRAERKRQHLTQTELADLSGVSLSFITNIEKGKPTAELGKTLDVLNTLGIDILLKRRDERE